MSLELKGGRRCRLKSQPEGVDLNAWLDGVVIWMSQRRVSRRRLD
ncbi:hypothetical protein SynSYN20_02138 [Synechococcus sp. SYN20]|nr:hypothetical protein SynSYN20_02138 [Synechococcus sp. SYN20]